MESRVGSRKKQKTPLCKGLIFDEDRSFAARLPVRSSRSGKASDLWRPRGRRHGDNKERRF